MKDITFEIMRKVCKFFSYSYDSYIDMIECACHSTFNIPKGDSWGICSQDNCPYLNLEERIER